MKKKKEKTTKGEKKKKNGNKWPDKKKPSLVFNYHICIEKI